MSNSASVSFMFSGSHKQRTVSTSIDRDPISRMNAAKNERAALGENGSYAFQLCCGIPLRSAPAGSMPEGAFASQLVSQSPALRHGYGFGLRHSGFNRDWRTGCVETIRAIRALA